VTNIVGPLVLGQFTVTNISIMQFNPQTALMEQTIRITNIGSSNVASARVMILGSTNPVYNAVGTNNTFGTVTNYPFVIYGAPLNSGDSADLLLEYASLNRSANGVTNNISYVAVGAGPFDATAPGGTNSTLAIDRLVILANGSVLIEWASTPGKNYSILYSDTNSSATTLEAQPSVTAQADRTQWVDSGPPKTVSPPGSVPMRLYRLRQNN
jgi:hypothetical protein